MTLGTLLNGLLVSVVAALLWKYSKLSEHAALLEEELHMTRQSQELSQARIDYHVALESLQQLGTQMICTGKMHTDRICRFDYLCYCSDAEEFVFFHSNSHDSVKLIKFADDTTLIGLISNNDESAYRREVDRLVSWCSGNNLELNAQKTVEMIVDFRKSTVPPPPPSVMDSPITSVESFRFLGTTITQDLKWEPTISSLIKKAQQRMYFLRQLRKAKLPAQMLVQFYTAIIESILTSSVTVWFAGATVRDKQRLQRIVRSAEEVIGRSLPSLQDLAGQVLQVDSEGSPGHREMGWEWKKLNISIWQWSGQSRCPGFSFSVHTSSALPFTTLLRADGHYG
uniref:Alkylated DNA repair protein AlkB homologue 8 N-terminal domain-containing protein n=1 Tax=Knipowitschia caucasica TaxID=637954 RepID=A0AAV2MAQ9_KNICA